MVKLLKQIDLDFILLIELDLIRFTYKLDLGRNKTIALANLSINYTWKNIKSSYNNNKFEISGPIWSETFHLPDGSYEMQDIQDYFLKNDSKTRINNKN